MNLKNGLEYQRLKYLPRQKWCHMGMYRDESGNWLPIAHNWELESITGIPDFDLTADEVIEVK